MTAALFADSKAYSLDRTITQPAAELHASKSLLCVEHNLLSSASLPVLPEETYPSIAAVQSSELPHCTSVTPMRLQLCDRVQSTNSSFLSSGLEKLQ